MSSRSPEDGSGLPPDRTSGGDDVPELEPEFREALREAAGKPDAEEAQEAAAEAPEPQEAEPDAAEQEESEPDAEEQEESEPDAEEQQAPEPQPGMAETAEYAVGEAPDVEQEPEVEEPQEGVGVEEAAGDGAGDGAPPAEAQTEVGQAVAVAADSGRAWMPPRPPAVGDPAPPPRRKRLWWRFSLASFLIVASVAAATAASLLLYLDAWANKLQDSSIKGVQNILDSVPSGGPETILILGSDQRASDKGDPGRSDTTILLRLDPDQGRIALMSIPRDLKVHIPGYGVGKFNAAYTYGGPKLTLRLVKRLTGLDINHLVNVDFLGFVKAVDAIGCVWADVDRRYYHSNVGVPPALQYSEINVAAGYQRLCGKDALAYVRYRHTDTDLVRSARQQDFLREARQRVPLSKLINDRHQLLTIFTSYTTSDINNVGSLLEVLKVLYDARGSPIKEVHFPAVLGPSYVYASHAAIHRAVDQFLGFQASGGPRGESEPVPSSHAANKGRRKKKTRPQSDGLVDAATGSHEIARGVARKVGAEFPVFYPRRLPSGSIYAQTPRVYHLRDTDGNMHGAYRIVLQLPLALGDYFGVQGIRDWGDPPILENPSLSKSMGDRDYDIYLDGDRIRLIAWHEGDDAYWVSNSLLQTLTNRQMLGIARSIGEITPKPKHHRRPRR